MGIPRLRGRAKDLKRGRCAAAVAATTRLMFAQDKESRVGFLVARESKGPEARPLRGRGRCDSSADVLRKTRNPEWDSLSRGRAKDLKRGRFAAAVAATTRLMFCARRGIPSGIPRRAL